MLGLVADYSSEGEEQEVELQQKPQDKEEKSVEKSKENKEFISKDATNFSSSVSTEQGNILDHVTIECPKESKLEKKESSKKRKRKKSTREIVAALGLDKEIEQVLEEEELKEPVSQKRKTEENDKDLSNEENDEYGFENEQIVASLDQIAEYNHESGQQKLLSDDFFDRLHERQVPLPYVPQHQYVDNALNEIDTTSITTKLPSNLPPEVMKDLQRTAAATGGITEVNAQNRSAAYLHEVRTREIMLNKHRQQVSMEPNVDNSRLMITNTQRAKNQLLYLAQSSKTNELDIAERNAIARLNKRTLQKKYGWT